MNFRHLGVKQELNKLITYVMDAEKSRWRMPGKPGSHIQIKEGEGELEGVSES